MNLGTVFYTVRNFVKLKIGWTYSSNGATRSECRIFMGFSLKVTTWKIEEAAER
jgi:hypothetical protein